ncbi:unnamed protein product [Prunus armeniaca]
MEPLLRSKRQESGSWASEVELGHPHSASGVGISKTSSQLLPFDKLSLWRFARIWSGAQIFLKRWLERSWLGQGEKGLSLEPEAEPSFMLKYSRRSGPLGSVAHCTVSSLRQEAKVRLGVLGWFRAGLI